MYVIDSGASLASVHAEWDELADRLGAGPFVRPGWFEAWAGAFGKRPLEVLAVREDGRLAGVLPLLGSRVSVAAPANWHTPVFGAVADSEAALDALAGALLGRGAARVDLAQVDALDPLLAALRRAARRSGHRTV
jgi:CelD/BcsL family acetyltransferase involved in cellulose biosynthesis